jgi:hypothetical protein
LEICFKKAEVFANVEPYFGIEDDEAGDIIKEMSEVTQEWEKIANKFNVLPGDIDLMAPNFMVDNKDP